MLYHNIFRFCWTPYIYVKCLLPLVVVLFLHTSLTAQHPPTLSRSPAPPDVSEAYRPNPWFYEVMNAFPHTNSYVRYQFSEVRAEARRDPEMMVILGDHHRIGRQTPVDHRQAMREYQRAASRGSAMAHHRIAYMYADGLGVPRDREKILEHLRLGADGGDVLAQYDYAQVYLNGKFGESRDLRKAYHYLVLASEQGHRLATELLAMLAYHQGAPAADIPYGLTTALELYRKVGDTDGERQLKEKIHNWSGMRYYLRTLPGFVPGLDGELDPTDPIQGIQLIDQIHEVKEILGDEIYHNYLSEIAQNILYHSYFNAQGNREKLLRFLVLCHQHDQLFEPYLERYVIAAARDFRLLVDFHHMASLDPFLREFATYPAIFTPEELDVVSDRVYVGLRFKNLDAELSQRIAEYLRQETWIVHHLSARYIVNYEESVLADQIPRLPEDPYGAAGVVDDFFSRYHQYREKERDTLVEGWIETLRLHAIHPWLTQRMLHGVELPGNTPGELLQVSSYLKQAIQMAHDDIDHYFTALADKLFLYPGSLHDPAEVRRITRQVLKVVEEAGSQELDALCGQLRSDPTRVSSQLKERALSQRAPEMLVANNRNRWLQLYAETLSQQILAISITAYDPNGVPINPDITTHTMLRRMPCPKSATGDYLLVRIGSEVLEKFEFTLFNNTPNTLQLETVFIPESHPVMADPTASHLTNPDGLVISNKTEIAARDLETVTVVMPPESDNVRWIPVLRIANEPVVPFLLRTP